MEKDWYKSIFLLALGATVSFAIGQVATAKDYPSRTELKQIVEDINAAVKSNKEDIKSLTVAISNTNQNVAVLSTFLQVQYEINTGKSMPNIGRMQSKPNAANP